MTAEPLRESGIPAIRAVAMHFVSGASARHHPRRALGDSELRSACQSLCRPCLRCAALPPPAAHESGAPVVAVPRAAGDARSLRVRKATWGDVQSVARLCAAAFVEVPGAVPAAPQVEGWAEYLESRYQESMAREVRQAVGLALTRKARCVLWQSPRALCHTHCTTQHACSFHSGGCHRKMSGGSSSSAGCRAAGCCCVGQAAGSSR